MENRSINDVCIDICTMLEDSERDKKVLNFNAMYGLSGELSELLQKEDNDERVLDSSFLELTTRVKNAFSEDNLVPWEHVSVYNTLFGVLHNEFPSLFERDEKDTRFISYGDLRKIQTKGYAYSYRKS